MSWKRGFLFELAEEVCDPYQPDASEDVPYIGLEHVEQQTLHLTAVGTSLEVKSSKQRFHQGDVLFGTMRPYFRKVVRTSFDGVCSTEFSVVRAKDPADADYVFYFIAHPKFIEFATVNSKGDRPRTKWSLFSQFPAQIPPASERWRIGSLLSTYDDLIENNRRRMVLLEETAGQLYREWFVRLRFPGHEHTRTGDGVPAGWVRTRASTAMEVLSGGTPKTTVPDYWNGNIPFYTPKDATSTSYVLTTERSVTELGLKNCNSRLYPAGTIFISARGTVGKLNLAGCPMAMSQSCYALVGKGHISQPFLFCALKDAIEQFRQHAVGAVFDAIVVDTFKVIPFTIPPENMVRLFEEGVVPVFAQVRNLVEQNEKLRAARDLLLPRLMSGEITV